MLVKVCWQFLTTNYTVPNNEKFQFVSKFTLTSSWSWAAVLTTWGALMTTHCHIEIDWNYWNYIWQHILSVVGKTKLISLHCKMLRWNGHYQFHNLRSGKRSRTFLLLIRRTVLKVAQFFCLNERQPFTLFFILQSMKPGRSLTFD